MKQRIIIIIEEFRVNRLTVLIHGMQENICFRQPRNVIRIINYAANDAYHIQHVESEQNRLAKLMPTTIAIWLIFLVHLEFLTHVTLIAIVLVFTAHFGGFEVLSVQRDV